MEMARKSIDAVEEAVEAALAARADQDTGNTVWEMLHEAGFSRREARALLISSGNAFETVIRKFREIEKPETRKNEFAEFPEKGHIQKSS